MLSNIINTSYRDIYGNKVVYDNDIQKVFFYDASNESWTRSDTTASWYLERYRPNDPFIFGLDSNIWQTLDYKGTISRAFSSSGLTVSITNEEARGGLSSNEKWSLSGDFSLSIFVNMSNYYNEYKSKTSSGLSVSISETQKVRVGVYFDGTTVGLKSQYVSGIDLKYIGWFPLEENTSVDLTNKIIILTISRSDSTITCSASIAGTSYSLGYVEGTSWDGSCYACVEIETEQYNSLSTTFTGFLVNSGAVSGFTSTRKDRSGSYAFPEKSILVIDSSGLSIIDQSNMSLWSRFVYGTSKYFVGASSLSASGGRIFCGTSSGLYVIDFVNDLLYLVDSTGKQASLYNLDARNYNLVLGSASSPSLLVDAVQDVSSTYYSGSSYTSVATVSGMLLLKDLIYTKYSVSPHMEAYKSKFSENGSVYWFCKDSSTGETALSVVENATASWGSLSSPFTATRYYETNAGYFGLLSDEINAFSVFSGDSGDVVGIATNYGIEAINYPKYKKNYGATKVSGNYISDASFESNIGVYWLLVSSSYLPRMFILRSSAWSTAGDYSAKFYIGSKKVNYGDYAEIYQYVDFTNLDYLLYDLRFVNGTSYYQFETEKLEVLINGTVVATHSYSGNEEEVKTYLGNRIDTSGFTGSLKLSFRLTSIVGSSSGAYAHDTGKAYYIDNIRTNSIVPDYGIFSVDTTTNTVVSDLFVYSDGQTNKVLFINSDGFGSIDIDSNTMEYFVEDGTVISGSSFNGLDAIR